MVRMHICWGSNHGPHKNDIAFEHIVDLCQDVGLVWGKELYFDGTKVEANADFDSLVPRFYHEAKTHLDGLFVDEPSPDSSPLAALDLPTGVMRLPTEVNGNDPSQR